MAPPKTSGKRAKLWAGIKKGLSKLNCLKDRSNVHAYTALSHGEKEGSTPLNRANAGDTITFGHSGVGMRGSDEWDALKDACGRNELQLEMVGDAIVVGNEKAFVMLDSVRDLKKEVRELRRAKAVAENRVAEVEDKLRTNVIEQASGYAASRNKFVTALKLKTTEEVNEYDKRILADEATRAATVPDAVSDALLFMPLIRLRRVDVWFYRDLYGMEPAEVLRVKGEPFPFPSPFFPFSYRGRPQPNLLSIRPPPHHHRSGGICFRDDVPRNETTK
jgi:hypothetical protein